jgi:hypothetical protein
LHSSAQRQQLTSDEEPQETSTVFDNNTTAFDNTAMAFDNKTTNAKLMRAGVYAAPSMASQALF